MSTILARTIDNNYIYADRSDKDGNGNNIASTYATQASVSAIRQVPAAAAADENKVLGVTDAQGSVGWVQGGGANTHTIVVDDVNPYGLPPKTMRVQFGNPNYDPTIHVWGDWVCTQVSSSPNVWDITFLKSLRLDDRIPYVLSGGYAVLDINLYGVTSVREMLYQVTALTALTITNADTVSDMSNFCYGCSNLTSVTLPPLHNVTTLNAAFNSCSALTSASLQGLDHVVDMNYLFYNSGLTSLPNWAQENFSSLEFVDAIFCYTQNVQSGILDMYNKLSSIATITSHADAFLSCGANGPAASELNSIPSSWGGYGAE